MQPSRLAFREMPCLGEPERERGSLPEREIIYQREISYQRERDMAQTDREMPCPERERQEEERR